MENGNDPSFFMEDEEKPGTSVTEKCLGGVNPVMTWVKEERTPLHVRRILGGICLGDIVLKDNI